MRREVSAEESRLHYVAAPQIAWAVGGGCSSVSYTHLTLPTKA